ncbi:MAG: hypothetical protein O3C40_33755 [Planctomycetota bacterium]|nr:hypothetical protein [Planctomycetota bacterium]
MKEDEVVNVSSEGSVNPYAAPAAIEHELAALVEKEHQPRPLRALGRWTLICCISAAPSFFWGCALHRHFEHIVGMICGILVFVLAYTVVECTHYYQQIITRPHMHRTVLFGYGTRIMFSVIFPAGLAIDMMTGIISVAIIQNVSPANSVELSEVSATASAFAVFLTTVVQGILLNIMLFGYMVCVYGVLRVMARVRDRFRDRRRELAADMG